MSVDLGQVYSEYFEKTTKTTALLDRFYEFFSGKGYNTLCLKGVFVMWKPKPGGTIFEEIVASVSFYIQDWRGNLSTQNAVSLHMSITDLKQIYCERIVPVNENSTDKLIKIISAAFENDEYDENGDFIFERPYAFSAQNSYYRDIGFGRTDNYYIVGVHFNVTKK